MSYEQEWAVQAEPERAREVPRMMGELDGLVQELESDVKELESRLAPFTRNDETKVPAELEMIREPVSTTAAQHLDEIRNRARSTQSRIRSILSRLEV